jgi:hypothetical protein
LTAFLHLLALRDRHQAEAFGERPERRPTTPEDAQPPKPPSRAEILGACIIFVSFFPPREEALCLICKTLASVFAPVLLRDDIDAASPVSLLGKRQFLLYFMRES